MVVGKIKKILVDARCMRKNSNGPSQYTFNLFKELVKIDVSTQYIFVVNKDFNNFVIGENVEFIISSAKIYRIAEQFLFPWLAMKHKADLFYTMQYLSPIFIQIPSVITVYDTIHMEDDLIWSGGFVKRIIGKYAQIMSRISLKNASLVISISAFSKESIKQVFGASETKVQYSHLGVSDDFFSPEGEFGVLAEKYNIRKPFILTIGNLRPYKNIETLVDAYKKLLEKNKDVPDLVIAGKAGEKDRYRISKQVLGVGLPDKIRMIGSVDIVDLPLLFGEAEVFVFPSLMEGFGIPVLEAMAAGTSVITSGVASMPEIGGDTVTYLKNPKDANELEGILLTLLESKDLREEMSQKAVKRAREFKWRKLASDVKTYLSEVLN